MFKRILIEESMLGHARAAHIISKAGKNCEIVTIDKIENYFGKFKRPYLEKRDNLWLYIGEKKGELVKKAPNAYGVAGEPHYYFVHAYNCIYECSYCYLQGHFSAPDIVLYLNHENIGQRMLDVAKEHDRLWFHAGEFSDSLALSHLTGELPFYFGLMDKMPHAKLEFRTKSVNISGLQGLAPRPNIIMSFSLMPGSMASLVDLKAPPVKHRLLAMEKLASAGFKVAIHFDPIIYSSTYEADYAELIEQISLHVDLDKIEYVSLGVVRFTDKVLHEVEKNYPDAPYLKQGLRKGAENLVRYPYPLRSLILKRVESLWLEKLMPKEKIYWCMEDEVGALGAHAQENSDFQLESKMTLPRTSSSRPNDWTSL